MEDDVQLSITLGVKQRDGIKRPVAHVLMPDGRVTEFKGRSPVLVDEAVYALLINSRGEVMCTVDGEPAIAPVPVI